MIDTIPRAFRPDVPAVAVWRRAAAAFSRDEVKQYLSAVASHDATRRALHEAGLDVAVDARGTRVDAHREAQLTIAADPEEFDFPFLRGRIRDALRDFHPGRGTGPGDPGLRSSLDGLISWTAAQQRRAWSSMTNRPRIEIVGVMLGLSAMKLTDPFVHSWWPGMVIAVSVAALGAFAVGHAFNSLPLVSPARLATVSTVVICGGGVVAAVIAGPRANAVQEFAIVLAGYVMLRLIGATVDRLTSWVNISLIASFVGTAVGLSTMVLVLVAHPDLSAWAVLGLGVGTGYMEGVITGFALRPGSTPAR